MPDTRPSIRENSASPWSAPAIAFFLFLLAYTLFMRLWNLGLKAVQHDESMFAYYSLLIYRGMPRGWDMLDWKNWKDAFGKYEYMPILHGPVLEWANAIFFKLHEWFTGERDGSDYSMRLPNAVASLVTMWLLFSMRKRFGLWPIMLGLLFLTASPTVTYFARFCRGDTLMHLCYVLVIWLGMKYADRPTGLKMAWMTTLLWFCSLNMETYVIFFFLIVTWMLGTWIHGTIKRKDWVSLLIGALFWAVLLGLVAVAFKEIPLYWLSVVWAVVGLIALAIHGYLVGGRYPDIPVYREFRMALFPHGWGLLIGLVAGFGLSVFMMTSAFNHMSHIDGQMEAFEYWAGQHNEHRIYNLFHFHWLHHLIHELPITIFWVVMMIRTMWPVNAGPLLTLRRVLYLVWLVGSFSILLLPAWWTPEIEGDRLWSYVFPKEIDKKYHVQWGLHVWMFLQILFVIMVVGWVRLERGQYFRSFLDYWAGGSALAYAYAGEKVPWVGMHVVIPMCISCGFYAWDVWQARFAPLFGGATAGDASTESASRSEAEAASEAASEEARSDAEGLSNVPAGDGAERKARSSRARARARETGPLPASSAASARPVPAPASGFSLGMLDRVIGTTIIGIFAVVGIAWQLYLTVVVCLLQPGDALERHSYASSHTKFHEVITYIKRESFRSYQGYETPITFEGEVGWPLFWELRKFTKLNNDPNPVFMIIDQNVMDKMPAYRDRYVWVRRPFRHYWVPTALDHRAMLKIPLLLRSPDGLTPELAEERARGRRDWWKLWNAVFVRSEENVRAGGVAEWRELGGLDAYFGKTKAAFQEAPLTIAPTLPRPVFPQTAIPVTTTATTAPPVTTTAVVTEAAPAPATEAMPPASSDAGAAPPPPPEPPMEAAPLEPAPPASPDAATSGTMAAAPVAADLATSDTAAWSPAAAAAAALARADAAGTTATATTADALTTTTATTAGETGAAMPSVAASDAATTTTSATTTESDATVTATSESEPAAPAE